MGKRADYDRIFKDECAVAYPALDAFEERSHVALDKKRLQRAARVLACPLKANPPNWQHGRVIYACIRKLLKPFSGDVVLIDVGTAKGFSAVVAAWALSDARVEGIIHSFDVIEPTARVKRNSVAECDKPSGLTIEEFVAPFMPIDERVEVRFHGTPLYPWARDNRGLCTFAFVDGKHTEAAVAADAACIRRMQHTKGDMIVFDDIQIDGVRRAVNDLRPHYEIEILWALEGRRGYAVARRK
jgi:hypothetical protein